jgi:hypothetical protein
MYEQKRKIPLLIYVITSIAVFATGLIYLFPSRFIPYDKEITTRSWNELGPPIRMLSLALMKGIGATLIGIGVAIHFLRYYSFSKKCADLALPITGLILFVSLLYININVIETSGSIPWYVFSLNILLIIIASALSFYYHNKSIDSECSF